MVQTVTNQPQANLPVFGSAQGTGNNKTHQPNYYYPPSPDTMPEEIPPHRSDIGNLLADLNPEEIHEYVKTLSPREAELVLYDSTVWARDKQLPPIGYWFLWVLLSGRGAGKTWSGANWINREVEKGVKRIALVARSSADVRDVMVLGVSGIIDQAPPWNKPTYYPSKRSLEWPNGAKALLFTAEEPNLLRGPQFEIAWCDELASWRYIEDTWSNLIFGLRLGDWPRILVTTTPRPIPFIKKLVADARAGRESPDPCNARVRVVTESTYANLGNLAPGMREQVLSSYEGTRLGRQELLGELLEDTPGALWTTSNIDANRITLNEYLAKIEHKLDRKVVAIDPATTSKRASNDTGIITAARMMHDDGKWHVYVIADDSIHGSPQEWAVAANNAYEREEADRVVGEVNNGGDLVEQNLRTINKNISYKAVRATRGKYIRAEPVSALYEQNRVHHVGDLAQLEEQICTWEPSSGTSPDRLDALVWAITELVIGEKGDTASLEGVSFGSIEAPSQWQGGGNGTPPGGALGGKIPMSNKLTRGGIQ